jgi:hypothetical protein
MLQEPTVTAGSDKPFELKVEGLPATVVFTCKLGSTDLRFILDTGSQESMVSDEAQDTKDGKTLIWFGQTGFFAELVPPSDIHTAIPDKTIMGVIGVDAVENMAVGIDYAQATATIWPKGASREQERNWMRLATANFKEIPLRISDRRIMLNANIGTRRVPMLVDTGASINGLADGMEVPTTLSGVGSVNVQGFEKSGASKMYLCPQIDIASTQFSWKPFVQRGDFSTISPQICWWPRVLLDFKNKRLFVPPDRRDFDLGLCLGLALRRELLIGGAKIFVSPNPDSVQVADMTAELLSVGKVDMEEVATSQNDTAKVFGLLCDIFKEVEHGCDIRIRNGDKVEVSKFKRQ